MDPLIMLYHIELFEILYYQNFVHDLPYVWNWNGQVLGIPKPGFCARKIYYQLVLLGQVVTNIYPIVPYPFPLAPTRPLPLSISP